MISIDEVHASNYKFPTIDFKFQNTGNATAFLWQFIISITHAEIDSTPDMVFVANAENGALQVSVTNQGWGAASECLIEIDEPTLNQIFASQTRQYGGVVDSGESRIIFDLNYNLAIPEQLELISKMQGIKLDGGIKWKCKDNKGNQHHGWSNVLTPNSLDYFVLTPNGFDKVHRFVIPAPARSDITYVTLIDPMKGAHERIYPISRKIPPGDIERFHIMIGSSMSCHLNLKFKFSIDKSKIIESDEFDIAIWNPQSSGLHRRYQDGIELSRELDELQRQAKEGRLDAWKERVLENMQRKASSYPFIEPTSRY